MIELDADIIVVGGGPAGSSCARRAAQLGMRVMLLERQTMPRPKLCGGALSQQAMDYLDFPVPSELVEWECFGARVHLRNVAVVSRLSERIAILTSRERLDSVMFEKAGEAGARCVQATARRFVAGLSHVALETDKGQLVARAIVVAQGATGSLLRQVRSADKRDAYGICVEHRFPLENPDRYADLAGLIDIYFGVCDHGYGWVFHHGNYYSVGVGGVASKFIKPVEAFHSFCSDRGFRTEGLHVRAHPIPRGGLKRKLVANRVILAGDSAGFVDPFYGEGLAYAIRSGQLAADVLGEAVHEGDLSATRLNRYEHLCDVEFGRNLRWSLMFSRLAHAMPNVFLRMLSSDSRVLSEYLKVPLNRRTYSEFVMWLTPRLPWFMMKSLAVRRPEASTGP